MGSAGLAKDHCHDGVLVFGATLAVGGNSGFDGQVADHIAVDNQEVASKNSSRVEVAHSITDRVGRGADDLDIVEGRNLGSPFRLLNVFLDLVGVGSTVDKYFVDSSVGEELEGIFDQRGIGQRKQTLQILDCAHLILEVVYVREGVQV